MITFVTLFLGLTAGTQHVALAAGPAVHAVEIQIDGRDSRLRSPIDGLRLLAGR